MKENKTRNQDIYDAYMKGEMGKDIAARFGIFPSAVSRLVRKMGGKMRYEKGTPQRKKKTCPKCHKQNTVAGAKFCPYCGTDTRSENDRLIERLDKLIELIAFLPESARDEARDVIVDAMKALQKGA